jgi:hypothetical protein
MAAKKKSPKRSASKASRKSAPAGRTARRASSPSKKAAPAPARAAARPAKASKPATASKPAAPEPGVVHSDVRRAALAWSFSRLR